MIRFKAKYGDREELLKLGAVWDFAHWQWCVEHYEDYSKFSKWLGGNVIISDSLYIVEGRTECPYCGKVTRLAAVGFGNYRENYLPEIQGGGYINYLGGFEYLTGRLAKILMRNFPVEQRLVSAYGYKYLTNGCAACNGVISDEYVFSTFSPFDTDDEEKAKKLKFYKVPLNCDVALRGSVRWSSDMQNLFKFAKEQPFSELEKNL